MTAKLEEIDKEVADLNIALNKVRLHLAKEATNENYITALEIFSEQYQKRLPNIKKDRQKLSDLLHLLIEEIVVFSRPVTDKDKITGRKKKGRMMPNRLNIKLRLPQDFLTDLAREHFEEKVWKETAKKRPDITKKLNELPDKSKEFEVGNQSW